MRAIISSRIKNNINFSLENTFDQFEHIGEVQQFDNYKNQHKCKDGIENSSRGLRIGITKPAE